MNKLLLAGVAGVVAAAAATPAQAHPTYHYLGGCDYFAVSDGTDSPSTRWEGEIHAFAVATDAATGTPAAVPITIECELRINGATPGTVAFSASGTGVAVGVASWSFHADPDDVVTICDNVTVGGDYHKDCGDASTPPPTDIVDQVVQLAGEILDEAVREIDSATCAVLAGMSGGPADQPPLLEIRSDGDIYIDGQWFWDCPPYGTSGTSSGNRTRVPAYGTITITGAPNQAPLWTSNYAPGLWNCTPTVLARSARVTCTPTSSTVEYHCPLMIVTATASQVAVGGRSRCNTSGGPVDTGYVQFGTAQASGDLGNVTSIVCEVYSGFDLIFAGPYTVTCNEPGAPTTGSAPGR